MIIIDGKAMASRKLKELSLKVSKFKSLNKIPIKLVGIMVGENEASRMYLNLKKKRAEEAGIESEIVYLPKNITDIKIIKIIEKLNQDKTVTGILVQLPLLKNLNAKKILQTIDPAKDVDGLTGRSDFMPATVLGILKALDGFKIEGKEVTIIGRSQEVGKPLAMVLIDLGATVTVCNSKTKDLRLKTKTADILISATGVQSLIKIEMVKPGAVVIDVGSPKGDVDFENVSRIASAMTPVPGGIGPLTIVSLLENTLEAAFHIGRRVGRRRR